MGDAPLLKTNDITTVEMCTILGRWVSRSCGRGGALTSTTASPGHVKTYLYTARSSSVPVSNLCRSTKWHTWNRCKTRLLRRSLICRYRRTRTIQRKGRAGIRSQLLTLTRCRGARAVPPMKRRTRLHGTDAETKV